MRKGKVLAGMVILSMVLVSFANQTRADDAVPALSPVTTHSIKNDVSPLLRSINPISPKTAPYVREIPKFSIIERFSYSPLLKEATIDPLIQSWTGSPNMPFPERNFEGIGNIDATIPPDPNGDVGPNHFIQWVNVSFAVWDKNGNLLYGPAAGNTLWEGFGGPCETSNDGDPIVLYDRLADRWFMSQFALPNYPKGPFYQCIAVSQTPDPTGSWYRYAFLVSNTKMNDYPKFGVWPDAYYMSVNQFSSGTQTAAGAGAYAFERDKMLAGQPATFIYFDLFSIDRKLGGMLPSHLNGPNLPPFGAPNYFVQFDDDAAGYSRDQLEVWSFHVDWTNQANSSFTGPTLLATAPFDSNMCAYSVKCIRQPGTTAKLDAIADRLMNRLQYRNFGDRETMVLNHTVDANGANQGGIRWYELRKTGSDWSIYQQGTFAPDGDSRWMGSVAMDKAGNMALGYSVSSTATYPSIRYTGRLESDPLGTLPQGETTLIAGGGSQLSTSGRWGDYSSMSVDPNDDCTFWYTQEYYPASSSAGWHTRIGSFSFPSCGGEATYSISGTITSGGTALRGVTVALGGAANMTTTTDDSGSYSFSGLSDGNYTVTPSMTGYSFSPPSQPATIAGSSVSGINFTATSLGGPYGITGKISRGGAGLSGATVTLSGDANATTTTNAKGRYVFRGLANGHYAVTPTKTGLTFTPANRSVTVNGANVLRQNFSSP